MKKFSLSVLNKKFRLILAVSAIVFASNASGQSTPANIPANIKAAAEARAGGEKIVKWTPDKTRNKYIATCLSEQVFRNIEIDMQGKWLRTTDALQPQKVPAKVMSTLKANYSSKGYEIDNYAYVEDHAEGKFYFADATSDDEDLTVYLDTNGKILRTAKR